MAANNIPIGIGQPPANQGNIPQQNTNQESSKWKEIPKAIVGSTGIYITLERVLSNIEKGLSQKLKSAAEYIKHTVGPDGIEIISVPVDNININNVASYFGPITTAMKSLTGLYPFWFVGTILKAILMRVKEYDLKYAEKVEKLANGIGTIATTGVLVAERIGLEDLLKSTKPLRFDLTGLEKSQYTISILGKVISEIKNYVGKLFSKIGGYLKPLGEFFGGVFDSLYGYINWAYQGLASLGPIGGVIVYALVLELPLFILNMYSARKVEKKPWKVLGYAASKTLLYTTIKYMAYPLTWIVKGLKRVGGWIWRKI